MYRCSEGISLHCRCAVASGELVNTIKCAMPCYVDSMIHAHTHRVRLNRHDERIVAMHVSCGKSVPSSRFAFALVFAAMLVFAWPVQAAYEEAATPDGILITITPDAPNPYTSTIGQGRNTPLLDPYMVRVEAGGEILVVNMNAISLFDDATVIISGSVVGNSNNGGLYGTGPNVIEANTRISIVVNAGAEVKQIGSTSNGEAINLHGFGNQISNYGAISSVNSAAIWFQDVASSGGDPSQRNVVHNYGTIQKTGAGGSVMGTSAGNGVIFYNHATGTVIGNLSFAQGDDDLIFEAGSSVTGNIDGGGGNNALTLQGDDPTKTGVLDGWVHNFQTLTKTGTGTWEITGSLEGFRTTTVDEGILRITGDNQNYSGSLLIKPDGVVEARPRSLPTDNPTTGYTDNITNNGTLRFIENDTSNNNVYNGQIVGSGKVEMVGSGVVILDPEAGANTYSGGTVVKNGVLGISSDAALGDVDGVLTLGDGGIGGTTTGTLRFMDEFDLDENRVISLVGVGGVIDTQGFTTTISQAFAERSDNLFKEGSGTLILTGDSRLTGEVYVNEGTLQLGDGNDYGSIAFHPFTQVDAGAALAYNRSDAVVESTKITGGGRVIQRGEGTLELVNDPFDPDFDNDFTGGTEIENGTILISDPDAYNKTDGLGGNAGTDAGHFLYSTVDGTATNLRTIEVDEGVEKLQNHFHAAGGGNNVFLTNGDLEISNVANTSPDRTLGARFTSPTGRRSCWICTGAWCWTTTAPTARRTTSTSRASIRPASWTSRSMTPATRSKSTAASAATASST